MRIEECVESWHRNIRGELPGGLDALLADDVVFISPIVFTPQKGKDLAKLYLQAAGATFGGSEGAPSGGGGAAVGASFHYTKEVMSGRHAVLEFETEVDGKSINGVDILTFDDAGKITEFKVMIRPLQAVNLMHQKMAAMIQKLNKG